MRILFEVRAAAVTGTVIQTMAIQVVFSEPLKFGSMPNIMDGH